MKISIIGSGNVGATCALRILERGLADVVLLDIVESLAKGKAEDLMDAASLLGHNRVATGTSDYRLTADSDIIVVTAGFARTPGMSREELFSRNSSVVKEVTVKVMEYNRNPIIITVTNPLDAISYLAYRISKLDSKRVIGMAGVLDSSRMNLMLARQLNRPVHEADALVLGTHGETMVPLTSHSKIGGSSLKEVLKQEEIDDIVRKTKSRGAEIVSYLGKGSAFYAPSAGVFKMAKAVAEDTGEMLPCSCLLNGEYGIRGVYLGVPAKIGRGGVKEIVELSLTEHEKELLKSAAGSISKQIGSLNI